MVVSQQENSIYFHQKLLLQLDAFIEYFRIKNSTVYLRLKFLSFCFSLNENMSDIESTLN
jgi:hypothetical protein